MAREAGDFLGLKNRLNNVAAFYLKVGDLETALARLEQALPMTRDMGDRPLECRTLANIGEVYLKQQKNQQAAESLREALTIASELELPELEINAMSQLGLAYSAMGNYALALNHFRRAIAITQKAEDGPNKAALLIRDYNRMGVLVRDLGDPAAAIAFHQSAAEQARAAGATALLASSEQQLAEARAEAAGSPEQLYRLRVDGLKRMLARLQAHQLDSVAEQVERQIAKLEEQSEDNQTNAPAEAGPAAASP
jgi:tetratricopeptide (TPR) repeat protein